MAVWVKRDRLRLEAMQNRAELYDLIDLKAYGRSINRSLRR
jgi:hypothetical protein